MKPSKLNGIACEKGEYKDFTGIIMWGETEGIVKNATFELVDWVFSKIIAFRSGTWKNGYWDYGIWRNGTWVNGTWAGGIWEDGTWAGGVWKDGYWYQGTWEDGWWYDGTWIDGTWKNGAFYGGIWEGGVDLLGKIALKSPNLWKGQK